MQKFGRTYRLTIDPKDGKPPILITLPFTVQFWIDRNIMADLNRFSIDIYNLSENNRNRIFQDRFDLSNNRTVIFEIGYSNLYRVFSGRIFEASSAREGTNIITRIEARDGQYDVSNTQTFQTLNAGQTVGDVIKYLIGQFPTLTQGAVGNYPDIIHQPVALNGNTWSLLRTYSGDTAYIDSGKIYVLQPNEVLDQAVTLISDATGLLETPRRDEGFISLVTLMEPGININQLINLQSTVMPVYNGQYPVIGIRHQGTISAAVCGTCRSTFALLHPDPYILKKVASS